MFLDERGTGLRVTWHPERDLVVLSVWQGDSCIGTFRMPVQDIPRLSGLLAAALGDWVDQSGAPVPGDTGSGGSGPGHPGVGGAGGGSGPGGFYGVPGVRITGEWDIGGGPGIVGGDPRPAVGLDAGLSVQQRIRLSRPMLRLRGLQRRRRRAE
jgi:hypothetical protein